MCAAEKVSKDINTEISVQHRHHYATVADVRLHWVEWGEPDGTLPLVLLHGIHDFHNSWGHLAAALSKKRRVLVPDLPGHGWSSRPDASYHLEWYALVMAKWLEHLNIDQVDLAGHSFGGGVAQMLLRECRHRIRRVALLAPGGLGREVALELRIASMPWLIEKFGQSFIDKRRWQMLWHMRHELTESALEELVAINAQQGSARAFGRTVRDVVNWQGQTRAFLQHVNEIQDLPLIRLFWGDQDRIIPIKHAHCLMEAVKGMSLKIFEGCGHYPHQEKPDHVVEAFQSFFDAPDLKQMVSL